MVTVDIRLLGPPVVSKAGRSVRVHSGKVLGLLAYLALETDAAHSREKLAALLWGENPESRARQSLRQALYSLCRTLGPDILALDQDTVALKLETDLWIDAVEFQALASVKTPDLELGGWHRAVELYRGLLLEGMELSGCPAFEEWLFFRRDGLEQELVHVLQDLIDGLLYQGRPQEALAYGQRLVTLNPLHEGGHRRLMSIHGALGDLDGVRHQFRVCTDVLERELGASPVSETQALYHELVTSQPLTPVLDSPSVHVESYSLALPFLGRDREIQELEEQLDRAARGQGRLVLVSGEAGAGKTRLVDEVVQRRTARAGHSVRALIGRCYALESRAPYAVWADALQPLTEPGWQPHLEGLAQVWREQLARLVPTLGPPPGEIEGTTPAESRLRLLQGVVQTLNHLSRSSTLCLVFDDLHWADEASLELLHYVARHTASLSILGTCRAEAVDDNPSLKQLLSDSRQVHIVELPPLDRNVVHSILVQMNLQDQESLADRLYRHSGGNPLFLVETLNVLLESGTLRRQPDDDQMLGQIESWPVPQRIQDLMQTRIASLGETQLRALSAAAVINRPFDLHLLRRVSGLVESEALSAVEQALRRRFLVESPEDPSRQLLSFRHGYFGQVIYEGLSTVQRRALHLRTARALVQLTRAHSPTAAEEIAHHFEQADSTEAIIYLREAAQQAERLYAYRHAASLYERALHLLYEHQPDDLERRFALLLACETVLERQGRRSEQASAVRELKELAYLMQDTDRQAIAHVREAGFLSYQGQHSEARQAGERALALFRAADDSTGEARALRELGFTSWAASDYGAALAYGRAALQLHRRLGDVEGEATALHNLAEIHRSLGSPRQSMAQYETALHLHWASQDQKRQGLTLYGMAHALRHMEQSEAAIDRYEQALAHSTVAGDRLMASRVHHALAGIYWQADRLDEALDHLQQALHTSHEIGYGPGIAHGLVALSNLERARGETKSARQHLEEAVTWLQLTEDTSGLAQAQDQLRALEGGTSIPAPILTPQEGWFKTHVALEEGKVYCAFESPLACR